MKAHYSCYILLTFIFGLFLALPAVSAQGDKKSPIDSYPLPAQAGAVRYTLADRWDRTDLTFYIHNCPSTIRCDVAYDAVRSAFQSWDEVSGLRFTELNSPSNADIELVWSSAEDGFGYPGDILAFAYFPDSGGDVYFDDGEYWSAFDGGEVDLYAVATHEIGHALGLDHSDDLNAIMYAYSGYTNQLGNDDVAAIQQLYGPDSGESDDTVTVLPPAEVPSGSTEMVESSLNNQVYYETWTIDVTAGETITFTMESLSGDLDAYLALLTPDEEQVLAEDDDSLGGTNSAITYTFPTTDDYIVIATRYDTSDGFTIGSYRLTAIRQGVDTTLNTLPTAPPKGGLINLTLYNNSTEDLCGVWFSLSDAQDWGDERLSTSIDDFLYYGFTFTWQIQAGTYDLWVEDCYGNYLDQYYITLDHDTEIEIRPNAFIVK